MRLSDLISQFDGFIIDQYGVLHDGAKPYPGAIAALEAINAAGKRAVLVTNSGKSAAANEQRLAQFGFARESYAALVSSGEAARVGIEDGAFGPAFAPAAKRTSSAGPATITGSTASRCARSISRSPTRC